MTKEEINSLNIGDYFYYYENILNNIVCTKLKVLDILDQYIIKTKSVDTENENSEDSGAIMNLSTTSLQSYIFQSDNKIENELNFVRKRLKIIDSEITFNIIKNKYKDYPELFIF